METPYYIAEVLKREFSSTEKAIAYAEKVASQKFPYSDDYARAAEILKGKEAPYICKHENTSFS